MKIAVTLVLSLLVVVHGEYAKRQLTAVLTAAEPLLSKLLLDKLGVDKLIGNFVGNVAAFFSGKSGTIPLEGTQLVLNYNIHKCHLHIGKRFLIHHIAEERCEAQVCENAITKSCKSCTEGHQADALKCALKAEVAEITRLAQAAQAAQG
ncbi:uncharacterized protein LOC124140823 [Haliotis rufescens]|uniref:uncharacterized protein LOC124140823 n=1 Tax=Haliotis rufescens TaxID=6454 RepID=UPI001EB09C1F|nr:uncharacterized protein LOC124140823 [Haliotis rufescens]